MRIDKYLWFVRLAKTRSKAAKYCNADKVRVNGEVCKAAKNINKGDEVEVRQIPIWRKYKVIDFPKSRVGAKLVADYLEESTTEADLKLLQQVQETNRENRQMGFRGRPTKKSRRDLDRFKR